MEKKKDEKTYSAWKSMRSRCGNTNNPVYHYYGGRGIYVCDRWQNSFEHFLEDMGTAPKGLSLDRVDNDKGYCKENCRWATPEEQAANKRSTHFIFYGEEKRHVADWARKLKTNVTTLDARLNKLGWSIEKTLSTPFKKRETVLYKGESAARASRRWKRSEDFVASRVRAGWSLKRAFTEPPHK